MRSRPRWTERGGRKKSAPMEIPAALTWWRGVPGGAEWLDRLPRLAAECAEMWQPRLGRGEHEAGALDFWQGVGAARLLAHDRRRRALLVERCVPGTTLWELRDEEEANRIACGVLRRLWRSPAERLACERTEHMADDDEFALSPSSDHSRGSSSDRSSGG